MISSPPNHEMNGRTPASQLLSRQVRHCYEELLAHLPWRGNDAQSVFRTLGVTSCFGGEGVTTVATHLAMTAADNGQRILLVDANVHQPLARLAVDPMTGPGWAEVLRGGVELASAIQPSPVDGLFVLGTGRCDSLPQGREELSSLLGTIATLKQEFDLVVFDLPPVSAETASLSLPGLLDGVLLVVEPERVGGDVALQAARLLERANAHVLGAVLNKSDGSFSA